jgi:hypothetical protein
MKMTEYIVCFNCLKKPTWQYAGKNHFACDSCLPREPCDCNYKLKEGIEPQFDENGDENNSTGDYENIRDENGRIVSCIDWNKL